MNCLRSATGPDFLNALLNRFLSGRIDSRPIRYDDTDAANAVSAPLVPGSTGDRGPASLPRRPIAVGRWPRPSAQSVGGGSLLRSRRICSGLALRSGPAEHYEANGCSRAPSGFAQGEK